MIFDINFLRKNHDAIIISQEHRYKDASLVDATLEHHHKFINERFNYDKLNEIKDLSVKVMRLKINAREIGRDNEIDLNTILSDLVKLTKSDFSRMATESCLMNLNTTQIKTIIKKLDEAIATSNDTLNELNINRMYSLNQIGNILHLDVIISDNENNNKVIRSFGDTTKTGGFRNVNLVEMISCAKPADKCADSRWYHSTGPCQELHEAMIKFGKTFLEEKCFKFVQPDIFSLKRRFKDPFFEEVADDISGPITVERILELNKDKRIKELQQPIRYYVQEPSEIGSFNNIAFTKIILFCITSPVGDESQKMLQEMIGNSESFYQALGIPYKVVSIVSGALDNAAAIKYQLEGWFPGSGAFGDLACCSNCTDYLARSVLTRYGEKNTKHEYVHMLHGTLSATTKTICAILENYQTENGIVVPTVLQPYMPQTIREFIPFVKK